ncbi:MmcB family DNA repair protein [Teichococcus aestuarii]|uniref:MmcB family DNA repair protein n=1 Tax=Teichococcus aestuarii TaxID=568898 RepID=UPI00361A0D53
MARVPGMVRPAVLRGGSRFPAGIAAGGCRADRGGGGEAAILRQPAEHRLAPARRKALLLRYARLAAGRLQGLCDPAGAAELRAALRVE